MLITTMKPLFQTALLLATLGFLFACTPPKVNLHPSMRTLNPDDYKNVFETWSRDINVIPINGLENILTARATYRSHEFRRYFAARVAADLNLREDETSALEAKELDAMKKGNEFYVTVMSAVADCDDLTPDDGPWTIRLKNDAGAEAAPVSVEEVTDPMPEDLKYYAFDAKFRKAYRLRFPLTGEDGRPLITGETRFFELSFATAYGRDKVRWEAYPK